MIIKPKKFNLVSSSEKRVIKGSIKDTIQFNHAFFNHYFFKLE